MPHLLFCVEGMEVVVVGELSAAGDVLESKEAYSVHPVHRPERERSHGEWEQLAHEESVVTLKLTTVNTSD